MPTHDYRNAAGERVPGVTTVIGGNLGWSKDSLMYWAWKIGTEGKNYRDERQKAASAGTYAHALAEADIRKLPASVPPAELGQEELDRARGAYQAYLDWRASSKVDLQHSEIPLVSEAHGYAGCIDAVGLLGGEWCLVDFKCTKATYADHLIQIAAYGYLWNECNPGCEISSCHLLRFSPEGDFHHSKFSDMREEFDAFLALLRLHNLKKTITKRAK